MKFSIGRYIISLIIISVTVPLLWYGYVGFWQYKTKRLFNIAQDDFMIRYGYILNPKDINPTFWGRNVEEGLRLVEYYDESRNEFKKTEWEKMVFEGDTLFKNPVSVPLGARFIGVNTRLYVSPDDLKNDVLKAYVFNTDCWGYFIAYIPSVNIHESEPPPELYEKFLEYVEKLPKSTSRKFGSLSPYGFYCN